MAERGGIDRLIKQACEILDAQLRHSHDWLLRGVDSPIEALFECAMSALYRLEPPDPTSAFMVPIIDPADFRTQEYRYLELYFHRQMVCLDWPVDYLFAMKDYTGVAHFAVVECDGHEFHERTKDQARRDRSRDRRLQAEGYRVFRFTGSEIYRDPLGCAREVMRWFEEKSSIGLPV